MSNITTRFVFTRAMGDLAFADRAGDGWPVVLLTDNFGVLWTQLAVNDGTGNPSAVTMITGASDNIATPFVAFTSGAMNYGYDGTNWDRERVGSNAADAKAANAIGVQETNANLFGFNGTTYDRARSAGNNADNVATLTLGVLNTNAFAMVWDGAAWDRWTGAVSISGSVTVTGNASNASDNVATSNTNIGALSFDYIWDGAAWDRRSAGVLSADAASTTQTGVANSACYLFGLDPNNNDWDRIRAIGAVDTQGNPGQGLLGVMPFMQGFNGTSWDRLRQGGTNADNVATLTLGALATQTFLFGFDGATWDRLTTANLANDAVATATTGILNVATFPYGFDSINNDWDRLRCGAINADNLGAAGQGILLVKSNGAVWNGIAWDLARSNAAANQAAEPKIGQAAVALVGNWSQGNAAAANTQATTSRAAVAGQRHICTSISARFLVDALGAPASVLVNLRDGATGAGTILWTERISVAGLAVGAETEIKLSALSIYGSVNTAMTLECSAAGGANTFESVSITGYTVA